jgi:hypothetical protein
MMMMLGSRETFPWQWSGADGKIDLEGYVYSLGQDEG